MKKKRGRPKGSKNKKKLLTAEEILTTPYPAEDRDLQDVSMATIILTKKIEKFSPANIHTIVSPLAEMARLALALATRAITLLIRTAKK